MMTMWVFNLIYLMMKLLFMDTVVHLRLDGRSGFGFDKSLDLIFDVQTTITDYGYIVSAIPFSSLRYCSKNTKLEDKFLS